MAEEHVPVRLSHLLRDCSVGAIVRGPESLMVVQDIRTWDRTDSDRENPLRGTGAERPRHRQGVMVAAALSGAGRDGSRMDSGVEIPDLDALRGVRPLAFGPVRRDRGRRAVTTGQSNPGGAGGASWKCTGCGGSLEQTPWVLVHEHGYLADVPWHDLAIGIAAIRHSVSAVSTGNSPI